MKVISNGNVKITMKSNNEILKSRKLDQSQSDSAQVYFTKQCAKEFDNYVPFTTGRLKNTDVEIGNNYISYNQPYAKKQYFTNTKGGERNRTGLRGKMWDKRCWNDKGDKILKNVAKYVGGRAE